MSTVRAVLRRMDIPPDPSPPVPDRWIAMECERERRTVDVNPGRLQVNYHCQRCRRKHTIQVDKARFID